MGLPDRRLVAIPVHVDLLIEFMRKGKEASMRCASGVPDDAIFVGSFDDPRSLCVHFVFYHPSFDVVPEGAQIPSIHVAWQTRLSEADLLKKLDRIAKSEVNFEIGCFFDGGYTARMGDRANGYTASSPLCDTIAEAGEWIVDRVDLWNQ